MTSFTRSLNFGNWPLWLKLSLGFLFAICVPLVMLLLIGASLFDTLGREKLRSDINHAGEHQAEFITHNLESASDSLRQLGTGEQFGAAFAALLRPGNAGPDQARITAEALRVEISTSEYFQGVRLVTVDGDLILQASAGGVITGYGADRDSAAYINAQNALIQDFDSSVAVTNTGTLKVELTRALRDKSGQVTGFLIGTLDEQHLIIEPLITEGEFYEGYTYLVTNEQQPVVISVPGIDAQIRDSRMSSLASERALSGQSGTAVYTIGSDNGISVIGFYAPISNPARADQVLFALVAEAPIQGNVTSSQQVFSGSYGFVILLGLVATLILLVLLFNQTITPPLNSLLKAMQAVKSGDFNQPVMAAGRGDELGTLSDAFVEMRSHVRDLLDDLEARVEARARDISATQEVSRFAATQRNLQTLLDQVVELIIEKFPNIYHAQVFLLDAERENVVLRASTGEAGKIMLARGHRLGTGSQSLVGQMVLQRRVIVVRDTAASMIHKPNELLPDTRAEAVLPLQIGGQIIGALDVQSKFRDTFDEQEVTILQTMADQVAVAIENARLYQESVQRMDLIEQSNRNATLKTWQEYLYSQRQRGLYSQSGFSTGNDLSELRRRAVEQGRIVVGEPTSNQTLPIAVPIQLRGQILGAVEWEIPESDFNNNKLQLAQELANRLAVSLDNARLFQESQRATERERVVNAISAKLTPQTDINDILQTAVREVGQALRAPQVSIRLNGAAARQNGNGVHPSSEN